MFTYYLQLAWRSIRRAPIISSLMILTLAVGVAVSMTMLTLQHVMSNNGLAERNSQIFALQLNNTGDKTGASGDQSQDTSSNVMPRSLTYRTVKTLLDNPEIAPNQAAMFSMHYVLTLPDSDLSPAEELIRTTSRDFFALFGVPFIYGEVWSAKADNELTSVVVIDNTLNQRLFNGENSVGRQLLLDDVPYQVVGVVQDFTPKPSVQDLSMGAFGGNRHVYLPFGMVQQPNLLRNFKGTLSCQFHQQGLEFPREPQAMHDFILNNRCYWLQYWVELPDQQTRDKYVAFLSAYFDQQKSNGFFTQAFGYALSTPAQWLQLNNVVSNDTKIITWLALVFLIVCIINAVALVLAKLLKQAPEAGMRRALGASKTAIFSQSLIETLLIGVLGGVIGIGLSQLGLLLLRVLLAKDEAAVLHSDWLMLAVTVLMAVVASIVAGLYPAWRISYAQPAKYLNQK